MLEKKAVKKNLTDNASLRDLKEPVAMNKKDIKKYNSKEEIESDYENFRKNWKYDRDQEAGVHKSGLGISKVSLGSELKIQYHDYPAWMEKMRSLGFKDTETSEYLKMLKNQFVIINEKEPYQEAEKSIEQRRIDMEDRDKWKLEMAKKYNHLTDSQLEAMAERLAKSREKVLKRWADHEKRSDR